MRNAGNIFAFSVRQRRLPSLCQDGLALCRSIVGEAERRRGSIIDPLEHVCVSEPLILTTAKHVGQFRADGEFLSRLT